VLGCEPDGCSKLEEGYVMYIMTKNGWQPQYVPTPTWVIVGSTVATAKRKGMRNIFEYFTGSYEKAVARAKLLGAQMDCTVKVVRNGKEA
jgi:hypothetical protein